MPATRSMSRVKFSDRQENSIHTQVLIISINTQVKHLKEGDRDDTVRVHSFNQGICTYVWVTLCTPEKGQLFPFFFRSFTARQHPPITKLITHPLCFLTAFCSDFTSQLFSWERGRKKPRFLLLQDQLIQSTEQEPSLNETNSFYTIFLGLKVCFEVFA